MIAMAQHTPGPWRVEPVEAGIGADRGLVYCRIVPVGHDGRDAIAYSGVYGPRGKNKLQRTAAECEADARLIAAAPHLLAALELVRSILPAGSMGSRVLGPGAWAEIDAAIAKARGAQHGTIDSPEDDAEEARRLA